MTRAHKPGRRSRTMCLAVLAVSAAMLHPAAAAARPTPGAPPARLSPQTPAPSDQPQVRTPLGPATAAQPPAQRHGVVPGQVVVTFSAGTSVTEQTSPAGRTSARTPATGDAAVNRALGNDAMGQTLVVDLTTGERVKTITGTDAYDDASPLMAFPMAPTTAALDSTSKQLDAAHRTVYSMGWNPQQIQQFSY